MRPLQLWLPRLRPLVSTRAPSLDRALVEEEWWGESTVWFLPWLRRVERWCEGEDHYTRRLALPAERPECVEVYHIDSAERVSGENVRQRFPTGRVTGLLDAWLNANQDGELAPASLPQEVVMPMPTTFSASGATYAPCRIALTPDTCVPLTDDADHHLELRLSPRLAALFCSEDTLDIVRQWQRMRQVTRQWHEDRQGALFAARTAAHPYLTPGRTFRYLVEFLPLLDAEGSTTAWQESTRQLRGSPAGWETTGLDTDWQVWAQEPLPIDRAWGIIGFFWAVLIERLEQHEAYRQCEACGRLNPARQGRRYCHASDNPVCYAARRARDKRKERAARATHTTDPSPAG